MHIYIYKYIYIRVYIYFIKIYKEKEKMFNNLKRNYENASEMEETDAEVNKKARLSPSTAISRKKEKKMMFFHDWKDGTFTAEIEPDYTGEKTVKLKDGKYNAMVTTPALSVRYSEMGPKGNLGTKFVPENAFTSAKFTMTLEKGADSKVSSVMPNIEENQNHYMKWLNDHASKMLTLAWSEKLPMFSNQRKKYMSEAKKAAKKDKEINVDAFALNLFLENASLPAKLEFDEDGEPISTSNKMGRRYQYVSKEGDTVINRPTIWKKQRNDEWQDITEDISYLTKGSIVITQVSFRCYAMPASYGVATDMGKNVILVYKKPSSGTSKDNTPHVPFFD